LELGPSIIDFIQPGIATNCCYQLNGIPGRTSITLIKRTFDSGDPVGSQSCINI